MKRHWIDVVAGVFILTFAVLSVMFVRGCAPRITTGGEPVETPSNIVTVQGSTFDLAPGSDSAEAEAKILACMDYYRARNDFDTARPYPGYDTARLRSLVTGAETSVVEGLIKGWERPTTSQLDTYRLRSAAQVRVEVRIRGGSISAVPGADQSVMVTGQMMSDSLTIQAEIRNSQLTCTVVKVGDTWKVAKGTFRELATQTLGPTRGASATATSPSPTPTA